MTMICIFLVTIMSALAAMRVGGVKNAWYKSITHCFVGFVLGAAWGIPSPVFFRTALALIAVDLLMLFYDHVYLRRWLHVDPDNPLALDPYHGMRRRHWGLTPETRHERWARGEPVEAPTIPMAPLRPTPPPPPKRG